MADLKKLNEAINELDKQSNNLRDFNSVYAEIAKLKEDLLESHKLLNESKKDLSQISTDLEKKLNLYQIKIDEIHKDNKAFQKEFDSTMLSRLDKYNSDIQVTIRNEGMQNQRTLESIFNSNTNHLESKLEEVNEKTVSQLNILKISVLVLIALSLGSLFFIFFK